MPAVVLAVDAQAALVLALPSHCSCGRAVCSWTGVLVAHSRTLRVSDPLLTIPFIWAMPSALCAGDS